MPFDEEFSKLIDCNFSFKETKPPTEPQLTPIFFKDNLTSFLKTCLVFLQESLCLKFLVTFSF
ncbi:hypothetical protein BpHYR1_006158 [Brachionus plicatilis]|uniref:Uncharacterized protein n=1 Tax=Brachionus plicatilis TaxID=10195 RepID=A0A3M7RBA2_BRAPC|nr:hypothetical protein BpHYR1_006158 [Brachionus plicatilis]